MVQNNRGRQGKAKNNVQDWPHSQGFRRRDGLIKICELLKGINIINANMVLSLPGEFGKHDKRSAI